MPVCLSQYLFLCIIYRHNLEMFFYLFEEDFWHRASNADPEQTWRSFRWFAMPYSNIIKRLICTLTLHCMGTILYILVYDLYSDELLVLSGTRTTLLCDIRLDWDCPLGLAIWWYLIINHKVSMRQPYKFWFKHQVSIRLRPDSSSQRRLWYLCLRLHPGIWQDDFEHTRIHRINSILYCDNVK